jgi:hypothetical protein
MLGSYAMFLSVFQFVKQGLVYSRMFVIVQELDLQEICVIKVTYNYLLILTFAVTCDQGCNYGTCVGPNVCNCNGTGVSTFTKGLNDIVVCGSAV